MSSLLSTLPISRRLDRKNPADLLVQKSCGDPSAIDTTTMPNSLLQPEQANRFIDLLVDESCLFNAIRVVRTNACSGKVHKLDLCQIVTEGACATTCPIDTIPDDATSDWKTEKYRSTFNLTSDFLECNIERGRARDTILNMFSKRMNMDMEIAALRGDSTVATGDGQPRINNLIGIQDGFGKILCDCVPDCQIIDAQCARPSRYLYHEIMTRVPNRYVGGLNSYRLIAPPAAAQALTLEMMRRETPLGDSALQGGELAGPLGMRFFTCPMMPSDIPGNCGGKEVDTYQIWYTPLQNLIVYINRDMTMEFERKPRLDRWEVTVHYKMGFQVENADLVVLVKNLSNCGDPYTECACETCEVC